MRLRLVLILTPLLAASAREASAERRWKETLTPHFQIFYESSFAPSGATMDLERLHSRLRQEFSLFAPWMAQDRVKVYLHRDRASYLRSDWRPPKWSNGVAEYKSRSIVTHEQEDKKRLLNVLSHEMSHLLFESFWGERQKEPPIWLNEGLAMVQETQRAEPSDWKEAMAYLEGSDIMSLRELVDISPNKDLKGQESVSLWYVQAYSLVYFLSREQTRMQFLNFCAALREGKGMDRALWQAYRYRDLARLEKEWRNWLKIPDSPNPSARAESPRAKGRSGGLRTVDFKEFYFHGLIPER